MKIAELAFFMRIDCQNGRKTIRKNFFKRQINTKVLDIGVTLKLNLPYPMN